MDVLTAVMVALAFTMIVFSMLVGIAIFAIADQCGGHRPGKRRVRSERTTSSSRGHRPFRAGRVRT